MRAAIIGIGAIAKMHARALGDIDGVELVGATCRTEEKGRAFGQEFGCSWYGDADAIGAALQGARQVRSTNEPHLEPWLARWAICETAPALFPGVDSRCDSFSQWWTRATRGMRTAADLLGTLPKPAR
jgi:hypothetical protein